MIGSDSSKAIEIMNDRELSKAKTALKILKQRRSG